MASFSDWELLADLMGAGEKSANWGPSFRKATGRFASGGSLFIGAV
jgi:hypothetical protein